MWSRAAGTMAPAFVLKTTTQGALAEICGKLRYTQPDVPHDPLGSALHLRGCVVMRGGAWR